MYDIEKIKNTILNGDALSELKNFPDESVDLIINSPPYFGLRSYSDDPQEIGKEKTVKEYVEKLTGIYRECKRVLKKTGSLWINISDVYDGSGAKRPQDYKKKYKKYGKDSYVIGVNKKINSLSLLGVPEQLMLSLIDSGWILRNKNLWVKSSIDKNGETKGGCMPTSTNNRYNQNAFEYFYFFVKDKKYYFNDDAVRVPYKELRKERTYGTAKKDSQRIKVRQKKTKIPEETAEDFGSPRARYHRKTDLTAPFFQEKGQGENVNLPQKEKDFSRGKIPVCVWQYNTIPVGGIHTALYPHTLLERPIKSCLPFDGILLDLFCGLATSWLAQQMYQPKASFIGIELNPEYIEASYKRIKENCQMAEERLRQEILL